MQRNLFIHKLHILAAQFIYPQAAHPRNAIYFIHKLRILAGRFLCNRKLHRNFLLHKKEPLNLKIKRFFPFDCISPFLYDTRILKKLTYAFYIRRIIILKSFQQLPASFLIRKRYHVKLVLYEFLQLHLVLLHRTTCLIRLPIQNLPCCHTYYQLHS